MKSELRKYIEPRLVSYIDYYLYILHRDGDIDEIESIADGNSPNWLEFEDDENSLLYVVLTDIVNCVGPFYRWAEKKAQDMAKKYIAEMA